MTTQPLLAVGTLLGSLAVSHAQSTLYAFEGTQPLGQFGRALCAVGDLDADGVPDVAVGDPADDSSAPGAGVVRVYSGRDGALLNMLSGSIAGGGFGVAIASVDDRNADGAREILVGSETALGTGTVILCDGATGSALQTFFGTNSGGRFGSALDALDDVDGDGAGDWIVGDWSENASGPDSGSVRVYSGATLAPIRYQVGDAANDHFGIAVAGLGDVDGDGRGDYAVGADGGLSGSGYVRVFSGLDGSVLGTYTGSQSGDAYGSALAAVADLNGDQRPDWIVGAPQGGSLPGYVELRSGADGALLASASGSQGGDRFGASVSGPGDVDGDGLCDFVVGAPSALAESGTMVVISGATGSPVFAVTGQQVGDRLGERVAGSGDVNADGRIDLLVAATDASAVSPGAGTVTWLLSGCPLPQVVCTPPPDSNGCQTTLVAAGAASLSVGNAFTLTALGASPQSAAILTWSFDYHTTPFANGLCLPNAQRLWPVLYTGTSATACSGSVQVSFDHTLLQAVGFAPGSEIATQLWIRDTSAPTGLATSDALGFAVCP